MRDPNQTSFGPTSGSFSGWAGEIIVLVVLIMALTGDHTIVALRVVIATLLAAALIWAFLLRSRVVLQPDGVLLRNAFVDTFVPYGMVDRIAVRTVTYLFVGQKRYVGTGVGRKLRKMARGASAGRGRWASMTPETTRSRNLLAGSQIPDFMEERILERVREAAPGVGSIRRTPAWPEIGVSAVLAVALLVAFLV